MPPNGSGTYAMLPPRQHVCYLFQMPNASDAPAGADFSACTEAHGRCPQPLGATPGASLKTFSDIPADTRRSPRRPNTPAVGRSQALENCTYRGWPRGTAGPALPVPGSGAAGCRSRGHGDWDAPRDM